MTRFFIILFMLLFVSCFTEKETESSGSGGSSPTKIIHHISYRYIKDTVIIYKHDDVQAMVVYPQPDKREVHESQTKPTVRIIKVNNNSIYNKTFNDGTFVYKIPSIMKVRETYQVIARISKSSVNIYENLNGDVRETTIPVTETMEVKLVDPSPSDNKMFFIVADNEQTQIVDSTDSYTQWSWNVTPLKTGKVNLKIVVSIIRNGKLKEVVYQDAVLVEVNPLKQITYWFSNYWQWLFTTLLIPVFKWLYDKYIKKKKDTE